MALGGNPGAALSAVRAFRFGGAVFLEVLKKPYSVGIDLAI